MTIFKRKQKNKSETINDVTSSIPESCFSYEPDSNIEDDNYYDYGIVFKEELQNGSLVFLIVDEDYEHAGGYIVVSPSGIPTIIKDDFYEFEDSDYEYLKKLAKEFFQATK